MKNLVAFCLLSLGLSGCVIAPYPTAYSYEPVVVESEVVYPTGIVIGVGGYWDRGVWCHGPYRGGYHYHGRYYSHRHR